jgi:NAD(P)-dependent dehydrogenase (short-subunit alcohol dehydrogenase family)
VNGVLASESVEEEILRLRDQVAIVTGGGSGIGQATAVRFAEEGAKVVIVDIDRAAGEETVSLIKKVGGEGLTVQADVSKENEVKQIAAQTTSAFGKIEILVNNAAVFIFKGIEATVEDWQRSLSVNILGTALCTKYAVEKMKEQNKGAIVNLGSISAMTAQPEFTAYSATKAAILQMTRNMALDFAPFHIRVNSVCPGAVLTPALDRYALQKGMTMEQVHAAWAPAHLLNRLAQPREIANAILFLASEEASFITGANLMVDGGFTVR